MNEINRLKKWIEEEKGRLAWACMSTMNNEYPMLQAKYKCFEDVEAQIKEIIGEQDDDDN